MSFQGIKTILEETDGKLGRSLEHENKIKKECVKP